MREGRPSIPAKKCQGFTKEPCSLAAETGHVCEKNKKKRWAVACPKRMEWVRSRESSSCQRKPPQSESRWEHQRRLWVVRDRRQFRVHRAAGPGLCAAGNHSGCTGNVRGRGWIVNTAIAAPRISIHGRGTCADTARAGQHGSHHATNDEQEVAPVGVQRHKPAQRVQGQRRHCTPKHSQRPSAPAQAAQWEWATEPTTSWHHQPP